MPDQAAGQRAAALDLRAAARAMLDARAVVLCAHVSPDGDAVGAVLALTLALRAAGVDATPTLADPVGPPATYSFLPGFSLYRPSADLGGIDLFAAIDVPNLDRLGAAEHLATSARSILVIDHHPDNAMSGSLNVVDPGAAAVGQMVWHMLPHLRVVPTPQIALCCYVALMTDTGRFSYGNTDSRTLRDAAEMVDAGADPSRAYSLVYESRSPAYMRLLGLTLSRVTHANGGKVAYSWYTAEDLASTGARSDEAEDLVDAVRAVGDVEVVFLIKAADGSSRVSLRAKDSFDVGAVARELGGGGHAAAAGATVDGGVDEALAAILPLIQQGARA
ncbi:MAG TPA: DHH family phosphoesterase [Coriobacteriia bacterium]